MKVKDLIDALHQYDSDAVVSLVGTTGVTELHYRDLKSGGEFDVGLTDAFEDQHITNTAVHILVPKELFRRVQRENLQRHPVTLQTDDTESEERRT